MATRRRNPSSEARELELFISNDSQLYRSQEQPIQKNLITKMARGVYNHAGAVKLYGYLMESGAKKYAKEHSVGTDWHQIFPPKVRKEAAEEFAKSFEVEAKLGNYDNYLPKKYVGWTGRQQNPTSRLKSNRLTPVKFTIKGQRHTGKAKLVGGKVKIFVTSNTARKINPKLKVYTFKYGYNWLAARGGRTAKYRSSSEEMAIKQFKLSHPDEPHYKIVKVGPR